MLKAKPVLLPGLDEYINAFSLLTNSRNFTHDGGETAIPFSEIMSYCLLYKVPDIDYFVRCLRAMDRAYLETRVKIHAVNDRASTTRNRNRRNPSEKGRR